MYHVTQRKLVLQNFYRIVLTAEAEGILGDMSEEALLQVERILLKPE